MLDTHWDLLLNSFSPAKFSLNVPHMLLVKDGESVQITKDVWSGRVACGLVFKRIKKKVRIRIEFRCVSALIYGTKPAITKKNKTSTVQQ